jgi:hypothetical protein
MTNEIVLLGKMLYRRSRLAALLLPLIFVLCKYGQCEGGSSVQAEAANPATNHADVVKSPGRLAQARPLPLPRLYSHFLMYVNVLDRAGKNWTAQGKDGSKLANDLQNRLRFTDTEFAPIRISANRLAANLADIDKQMKSLPIAPAAAQDNSARHVLGQKREAMISGEINALQGQLTADEKARLESFMIQFFAPKNIALPSSTAKVNSTERTRQ